MIYFYSGTPGSGKSLHVAKDIYTKLIKRKNRVIANFELNNELLNKKKCLDRFHYVSNFDLTPQYLREFAELYHKPGKESQTLLVIDECQLIFNSREWQKNGRMEWLEFFTQHRKYGYNIILVAQFDRMIDRQIRSLFEYEIAHRKVNNFKIGQIFPIKTFVCVTYWYNVKEKTDVQFFTFKKKYGKLYDSYKNFKQND